MSHDIITSGILLTLKPLTAEKITGGGQKSALFLFSAGRGERVAEALLCLLSLSNSDIVVAVASALAAVYSRRSARLEHGGQVSGGGS